ncbi:MAG: hypothetical protein GY775_02730 [Candidatus Scalindua sp.]|nr:hypothetical protein [Candidatus Scalindua sp.]
MSTENPLIIDIDFSGRHSVSFKKIKCIQTEDRVGSDNIYYIRYFGHPGGGGDSKRFPGRNSTWPLNTGERAKPKIKHIFPGRLSIYLREEDDYDRDDHFDRVTFSEQSDSGGGNWFPLPVVSPTSYVPEVRQRSGLGRGIYNLYFRVLPKSYHFLSNLRDAAIFLIPLDESEHVPPVDEIFNSFCNNSFKEMFNTFLSGRILSELEGWDAVKTYAQLNACRRQLGEIESPGIGHAAAMAENHPIEWIRQGIESEVETIQSMLDWKIENDLESE